MSNKKLVLAPACNEEAKYNAQFTLKEGVDIELFKDFVTAREYEKLEQIYPSGKVTVWGACESRATRNFDTVCEGDIALFTERVGEDTLGKYTTKATIVMTKVSDELGEWLWGKSTTVDVRTGEANKIFNCIYFVKDIEDIDISYKALNTIIGYSKNYKLQHFTIVNAEKSYPVIKFFNFDKPVEPIVNTIDIVTQILNMQRENDELKKYVEELKSLFIKAVEA